LLYGLLDAISKGILDTDDGKHSEPSLNLTPVFRDGFDFFIGEAKGTEGALCELLDGIVELFEEVLVDL
jgi:hypothetical protein